MRKIKVGSICLNSTPDVAANLTKAERAVRSAAEKGCDWVVLPEVFPYIGPDKYTYHIYKDIAQDVYNRFANLAAELDVFLFAGTMPQPAPDGQQRLLNRLYVFDRQGRQLAQYDKAHLFELCDSEGRVKLTEKKVYAAGSKPTSIVVDGFNVALAICYDIRFLPFFSAQELERAIDVVVLPAAFTQETGRSHWELLLRARALDLQAYVIGAAQTGIHFNDRQSYGHAMIVDPWAEVLCDSGEAEGLCVAELDPNQLSASRLKLPQRSNQRPDLYKQ